MSYEDAQKLFGALSNEKRLEVMQAMFRNPRWDGEVRGHIEHLVEYWAACFQNRNLLMHAHLAPLRRNEALAALLVGTVHHLKLQKPANKDWSKKIYLRLSLPHLRSIADQMRYGRDYATGIYLGLLSRDGPWGLLGNLGSARQPWPDKPRVPGVIQEHLPEAPEFEPLLPLSWPETPEFSLPPGETWEFPALEGFDLPPPAEREKEGS